MDDAAQVINTASETAQTNAKAAVDAGRQAYGAAADAAKATFDKAAVAGDKAFKDAADKSLGALNELNAQSKRNLEALVASATAATHGAEALGAQADRLRQDGDGRPGRARRALSSAPAACRKWSSCRPASPSRRWRPTWPR